ncbi:MAG: HD domain-containing protein [Azospirillaceae bacterium]
MSEYPWSNIQLFELLAGQGAGAAALDRARAAYAVAQRRHSAQYRPDGRPFVSHLVRTAGILARHGEREAVVLAGLVHAVYAQGDFGATRPGATPTNRAVLRAVIGAEAEDLVARYTAFAWSPESARRMLEDAEARRAIGADILVMRIANELEEALDGALAHVGARMRVETLDQLALSARLARSIDRPGLGEAVDAVLAVEAERAAPAAAMGADGSYVLLPASAAIRQVVRARRLVGRLRRGLAGRALSRTGGSRP